MARSITLSFVFWLLAGLVAVGMGSPGILVAQEKEIDQTGRNVSTAQDDEGAQSDPKIRALERIAMALQLAHYGREQKSPEALILAARVLGTEPSTTLKAKSESEAGEKPAESAPDGRPEAVDNSPQALLAEAKKMAGEDPASLAFVDRVAKEIAEQAKSRGNTAGPDMAVRVCPGEGHVNFFNVGFFGGEPAIIQVAGSGNTNLDLYVYDQNNNLIAFDENHSNFSRVVFRPVWTGPYRVLVRNRGLWNNQFTITSN